MRSLSLSLFLSLSLSLRVAIYSQSLTWASEGLSEQPVRTSLCREIKSPDFGTGTGAFTATFKGGIHPQLTRHQHWRRLWELNKNVNTLKKLIVNHG